jgi:choline dehydrogenase-like flavoprotein
MSQLEDGCIQDYLKGIQKRGLAPHKIGLLTAHQLSSCRMSASQKTGGIDENGETWECNEDMFVMDASTFPTASVANPMLMFQAMAHMVISKRWQ